MEIVRDQADKAISGWEGFQFHPTSKESAEKSVQKLHSKWFYRQVNLIIDSTCKKKPFCTCNKFFCLCLFKLLFI